MLRVGAIAIRRSNWLGSAYLNIEVRHAGCWVYYLGIGERDSGNGSWVCLMRAEVVCCGISLCSWTFSPLSPMTLHTREEEQHTCSQLSDCMERKEKMWRCGWGGRKIQSPSLLTNERLGKIIILVASRTVVQ